MAGCVGGFSGRASYQGCLSYSNLREEHVSTNNLYVVKYCLHMEATAWMFMDVEPAHGD